MAFGEKKLVRFLKNIEFFLWFFVKKTERLIKMTFVINFKLSEAVKNGLTIIMDAIVIVFGEIFFLQIFS